MPNQQARLVILNELMSFPTIRNKDWLGAGSGRYDDGPAQPGDLIAMSSAPVSVWYLSWLKETRSGSFGDVEYLLESVETEEQCWWSNIGVSYYRRSRLAPSWHWTDKQFAFQGRWWRVCFKRNDAYTVLPCQSVFNEDGSVILNVRIRHGFYSFRFPRRFDNWGKLTMFDMGEYYREAVALYEDLRDLPRWWL